MPTAQLSRVDSDGTSDGLDPRSSAIPTNGEARASRSLIVETVWWGQEFSQPRGVVPDKAPPCQKASA